MTNKLADKKKPKRYECLHCGFISDRYKEVKFPGMSFAVCFKCRGQIKEREKWIKWHREQWEKYCPKAVE